MKPLFYKIVRPLIKMFTFISFRPKIEGIENIPTNGPVVLAGNHTNIFDCILLISCTKRVIHFLAKDSLVKGFKKYIFKGMGIIPVNRSIHDKNALKTAIGYLKDGKLIGIFPEGTINKTNDIIMPFKIGAVKMSYETNATIVPFTITGNYHIFNNRLTIKFLKPYKIKTKDLTKENNNLMNIIRKELSKWTK